MSLWPTAQSILFLDSWNIQMYCRYISDIVIWSSLHIYHLLQLLTNIYPHVQVYGQCVKRPLPRHVIRILSGEFFGFLDEIGDVHWHLIDLGWIEPRSGHLGIFLQNLWSMYGGFLEIKSVHDVLMFYVLFYTNYSLKSFLFRVFPQKGHGSDFRNLGSVYGFLDQGFPTSPAEIKVQKEFQKRHGKKSEP